MRGKHLRSPSGWTDLSDWDLVQEVSGEANRKSNKFPFCLVCTTQKKTTAQSEDSSAGVLHTLDHYELHRSRIVP